jgi:hypothetical protein
MSGYSSKIFKLLAVLTLSIQVCASPHQGNQKTGRIYARNAVDDLAVAGLQKLGEYLKENPHKGCSLKTAVTRREW